MRGGGGSGSNVGCWERVEMTGRTTFRVPTDFLNARNNLDYTYRLGSYRAVNTLRLGHKTPSVDGT
jgi:hypothetical protein